jgi:hypothetical protein
MNSKIADNSSFVSRAKNTFFAALAKMAVPRSGVINSPLRFKWGLVDLNRSNIELYKLRKVFFGEEAARLNRATPIAPRRRYLITQNMSRATPMEHEHSPMRGPAGSLQSRSGLQVGLPGGLSWMGNVGSLAGSAARLPSEFALPMRKFIDFGHTKIRKRVSTVLRARSFAPVSLVGASGVQGRFLSSANQGNAHSKTESYLRPRNQAEVSRGGLSGSVPREGGTSETEAVYSLGGMKNEVRESLVNISRTMNDYFAHQARLPPSGAMAFDPRLTPAWAGLKLPV